MGNIGTWELDIKHNSVRWTDETYKIFDLAPGTEINNDLFLSYIHPDDRDYYDKKWEEGLNKGAYDIEHRIIVNDKVKLIREKVEFEFDKKGKPVTAIGFTQDITKNKKTEEKLKINELLFRTIFNEAPLGITLTDSLTGQFLEVNPMFAKIVGRTIEEIKHLDWKSITPPDDIQKDLDDMKRMNAGTISGFLVDLRLIQEKYPDLKWKNVIFIKMDL
jgi:PAS domain S-box-containing protein